MAERVKEEGGAVVYSQRYLQFNFRHRFVAPGCVVFFLVVGIMTLEIFINISGMNNDPRSMAVCAVRARARVCVYTCVCVCVFVCVVCVYGWLSVNA